MVGLTLPWVVSSGLAGGPELGAGLFAESGQHGFTIRLFSAGSNQFSGKCFALMPSSEP